MIGSIFEEGRTAMDYFAGLDVSMGETHVCIVAREWFGHSRSERTVNAGRYRSRVGQSDGLCRVVFETSRMAPMLHHGLMACGVPVICIESRQARQALKSLATHKTDRNGARGAGFFKPVHVKSLQAHAIRSLIIARKQLVGPRVTLENQIRGLSVVFGIRLPGH